MVCTVGTVVVANCRQRTIQGQGQKRCGVIFGFSSRSAQISPEPEHRSLTLPLDLPTHPYLR